MIQADSETCDHYESEAEGHSNRRAMRDGIDEETAVRIIHTESPVADECGDILAEAIADRGVCLPDQIRIHAETTDIAARLEKPAVVDFPETVHADDWIDP